MQLRYVVALTAAVACLAAPPAVVDTSVSSAIAETMAAIAGRVNHVMPRIPQRSHKLGLAKVKKAVSHISNKKVELLKKAEAPRQLAGYLGWSKKPKEATFTTEWKNSGAIAAKNLYMHDLQEGHTNQVHHKSAPQKEALVSGKAVTTAFSKMLEDQVNEDDDHFPTIDWGAKKAKPTMSLKAQASNTKTNGYLDAVGWTAPEVVKAEDNEYMRTLKEDPSKKKFLAAVAEKKEKASGNNYFNDLMPKYFDVEA